MTILFARHQFQPAIIRHAAAKFSSLEGPSGG
jgi:hypothetical protein